MLLESIVTFGCTKTSLTAQIEHSSHSLKEGLGSLLACRLPDMLGSEGISQSLSYVLSNEMYHWIPQECPTCEVPPRRFLGRRGGAAHRAGLGVESKVWRCGRCGLIFPNPMPIPVKGLEQHHAVDPGEYFEHHELEQKILTGNNLAIFKLVPA